MGRIWKLNLWLIVVGLGWLMAGGNVPAQLAPIFQAAGRANRIPANVLAGIASVESGLGSNTGPSSAGAIGLMQFLPSTARGLGVNPNDPRSAIFGAAKLLNQYGYQQNPTRAIGAYNGGPGNPQYGYARQVLSEASRLGGQLGAGGSSASMGTAREGTLNLPPITTGTLPGLSVQVPTFDQAGFDKAQKGYVLGSFLGHQTNPFETKGGPKFSTGPSALSALYQKGVLSSKPPNRQDFQGLKTVQIAHQQLQQIAGTSLSVPQVMRGQPGTVAGGFLPKGATYIVGRKDQGRDGQTNPGGPILANGNGVVVNVASDPNGFGPSYPIVHFTSGPYAGRTIYFGHTLATVRPGQRVQAGQVISHTGTHGIGNATVPGWFEIGFANSGSPGPVGQPVPF